MKYLVNRETKEHKILTDNMVWAHGDLRMVEADDEGWIKWDGGECPMPPGSECEFVCENGRSVKTGVDYLEWRKGIEGFSNVTFYRPILPAESKPSLEETWDRIEKAAKVDVFTRLSAAVAAADSIPALIAEINGMLPEGYEVTRK